MDLVFPKFTFAFPPPAALISSLWNIKFCIDEESFETLVARIPALQHGRDGILEAF